MRTTACTLQRVSLATNERFGLDDRLAVEEPLTIRVNGETLSVTLRTPGEDEELTLGFLYGEGLIEHRGEVVQVRGGAVTCCSPLPQTATRRLFPTHAACGACGSRTLSAPETPPQRKGGPLLPETLFPQLDLAVRDAQAAFAATGGLHAAALFSASGELLCLREDIGRHNAVDKLVGWALQTDLLPLSESLLFLSGRVGYELVQKASRAGVPVIVALGAPSSLAVTMCQDADITLVGFLRGERYNIYSGEWRIVRES